MGWDAFSSAPLSKSKGVKLKFKKHREAFLKAVKTVKENADCVDGFLENGGLDCSCCYRMLQKAAEKSNYDLNWGLAWNENGMEHRFVFVMWQYLNWDFKVKKEDLWAYWSAKTFVETCALNNLSIRFSN